MSNLSKIKHLEKPSKEKINELRQYVFDGNESSINEWFIEMNLNVEEYKVLSNQILHSANFFSFQSTKDFNREKVLNEGKRRELAILKNLPFEDQLFLLAFSIDKKYFDEDHYKVLKYSHENKKHKKLVKENKGIHSFFTELFFNEKFETIEKIEKILNIDILKMSTSRVSIYYKQKNISGVWAVSNANISFRVYYDIVYNYTENKKNYLESRNIKVIPEETVDKLKDLALSRIKIPFSHPSEKTDYEHISNNIELYIKTNRYYSLNNQLKINNVTTPKIKL